jgi:hypothetical protein
MQIRAVQGQSHVEPLCTSLAIAFSLHGWRAAFLDGNIMSLELW